jgi:molybdopterin synthase sulfur carrier subunit
MKVLFYATLREIVGGKTVDFPVEPDATVRELLDAIVSRYPVMKKELMQPDGRLYGHVHVAVNGRDVQFLADDLDTVIMPEDEISIFPAVGGGQSFHKV